MAGVAGALLDTSVLIARTAPALPPTSAISVITVAELRAGMLLARTDELRDARRARLDAVRAAFLPLPVDSEVADAFGDVLAVARRERRAARATDALIVATALAHARALHTLDVQQARLAAAAGATVELLA